MPRQNQQVIARPFVSGRTWEERYSEFTIYVEQLETDSGQYRTAFSTVAYVCQVGDPVRLFEAETGDKSGQLLRKANVPGNVGEPSARDLALAWLLENQPSAKAALTQRNETKQRPVQGLWLKNMPPC